MAFMLIMLLGLFAVSFSAPTNDQVVMVDVLRPRSVSIEGFNAKINNFWTSDRLRSAQSRDVVLPNLPSTPKDNSKSAVPTGPAISVPGSLPDNTTASGRSIASNGRQINTTGRVFWNMGSTTWSCSAAVIPSDTGDLISTAGHCVYDTTTKQWFNNNNWIFIPAYSNNNRPYGTWTARNMIALTPWLNSADFNFDVAFVALNSLNNRHIQNAVGSQGIAFNWPRLALTYAFGYPLNINNGQTLSQCTGNAQSSQWTQNSYIGQGLSCNMGGGCSGGPWLQNIVESTGIGYVTSVNSFTITNVPNVINGPYFNTNIQSLFNAAKTM